MKIVTNRDLYEEIKEVSKKSEKQKHQVKSRWYYIFWGAATLSVFAGQLYVGSGYRRMSKSIDSILEAPIVIDTLPRRGWDEHPMLIR